MVLPITVQSPGLAATLVGPDTDQSGGPCRLHIAFPARASSKDILFVAGSGSESGLGSSRSCELLDARCGRRTWKEIRCLENPLPLVTHRRSVAVLLQSSCVNRREC